MDILGRKQSRVYKNKIYMRYLLEKLALLNRTIHDLNRGLVRIQNNKISQTPPVNSGNQFENLLPQYLGAHKKLTNDLSSAITLINRMLAAIQKNNIVKYKNTNKMLEQMQKQINTDAQEYTRHFDLINVESSQILRGGYFTTPIPPTRRKLNFEHLTTPPRRSQSSEPVAKPVAVSSSIKPPSKPPIPSPIKPSTLTPFINPSTKTPQDLSTTSIRTPYVKPPKKKVTFKNNSNSSKYYSFDQSSGMSFTFPPTSTSQSTSQTFTPATPKKINVGASEMVQAPRQSLRKFRVELQTLKNKYTHMIQELNSEALYFIEKSIHRDHWLKTFRQS